MGHPKKRKRFPFWYELEVTIPAGFGEVAAGYLFEAGAQAVEERFDGKKTVLITHFPADDIFNNRIAMLGSCFSEIRKRAGTKKLPEAIVRKIEDHAWALESRRSFKPVEIVPGIRVAPTWKGIKKKPDETLLRIDPGEAFGTGLHPTTKTCAVLMIEAMRHFDSPKVFDVGTGTGILAMIAIVKGAGEVAANDNDPKALEIAAENFRHNNCPVFLTATPVEKMKVKFHVVVANLLLEELERLSEHLLRATLPGGFFVMGGLLVEQAEQIKSRMKTVGRNKPWRQIQSGEWVSMGFIKL